MPGAGSAALLESPTLRSLPETLHWRRLATEAEAAGWPKVRELWMAAQHRGTKRAHAAD